MRKYFTRSGDSVWPTVIWQGTQIVVYYLNDDDEISDIVETRGIDFDELLCYIDRGGSVFITAKPVEHETKVKNEPQLGGRTIVQ
jgi:hypothetical protein